MASVPHCYSRGEDGVFACGRQYRAGAYGNRARFECDDPGRLVFDDLYLASLGTAIQCSDLLEGRTQANGIWSEPVYFFDLQLPAFQRHRDADVTISVFVDLF